MPQAKTPRADEKRAYRIPEFCWRYGVGRSTAYKLAKEGRLRLVKIGNRTLILHEDAEALLQGPSDPMAAPPEGNPPGGTGGLGILFPDRNDFLSTTATPAAQAVIGIDPGIGGALALVSRTGELIKVADMPVLRDGSAGRASVNAPLLVELLARWHAQEVICEYVAARPGEGPSGAFSFGRSRGVIEGACAALGLPIRFLTPPSWKRLVGIPPGKDGAKDRARSEAIRRWPDKAALFARVRDDGRADAALVAIAGLKREVRRGD